ncbi:MAG: hypothetical protein GC190_20440 [Alphaproteobacteria bacterium]|nr:hypothetical protein [Alphaproteobacteria bacterium]
MAEHADQLSAGELERFLAWCKSEAKRTDTMHRQLVPLIANREQQVQAARLGLDASALMLVALKLERIKAGSAM